VFRNLEIIVQLPEKMLAAEMDLTPTPTWSAWLLKYCRLPKMDKHYLKPATTTASRVPGPPVPLCSIACSFRSLAES